MDKITGAASKAGLFKPTVEKKKGNDLVVIKKDIAIVDKERSLLEKQVKELGAQEKTLNTKIKELRKKNRGGLGKRVLKNAVPILGLASGAALVSLIFINPALAIYPGAAALGLMAVDGVSRFAAKRKKPDMLMRELVLTEMLANNVKEKKELLVKHGSMYEKRLKKLKKEEAKLLGDAKELLDEAKKGGMGLQLIKDKGDHIDILGVKLEKRAE